MDSSYISFSGIRAAEAMISNASDNISNLNTNGYKVKSNRFSSLIDGVTSEQGQGVKVVEIGHNFSSGKVVATDNDMDVAIDGDAFIEITDDAGNIYLSRGGRLSVSDEGYLQIQDGYYVSGMILMPDDLSKFNINENGDLTGLNSAGQTMNLGVIELVKPISLEGLDEKTGGIYTVGKNSGDVVRVNDGASKILQSSVELSNVDLTEELVKLMLAQNMYKANSNVVNINSTVSQWLSDLLQV